MISLPALLRWFTSRSLAPPQYLLPARGVCLTAYGLPHSAICGSKDVCSSPQLFAAYRGLLRRTAPRHPPQTYACLTIFSFPRFKLPTAYALKPSSLPYIFKEHAYPAGTPSLLSFLNLGQNRVELLTPALSERCSNQLSYCPVFDNSRTCCSRGTGKERKPDCLKTLSCGQHPSTHAVCARTLRAPLPLEKEVIQPHLPVRLPCYDFTPLTKRTFDSVPLAVGLPASGTPCSDGVTGGVYKARERIHRAVLMCGY